MSHSPYSSNCCTHPNRRSFLKATGIAAAAGLLSAHASVDLAAQALTKEQRDHMTPDEIIAQMKQGNERFRSGKPTLTNLLAQQRASAKGQFPKAAILSCVDSRTPAEAIMDLGIGDAFNARVAGNVANDDIIGSMEFACQVAGARVVVVMGHTACGAIGGAIDGVQLGKLTGLLSRIQPAVKATVYQGDRSGKNYAFVDAVARKNIELTVEVIRNGSPVLAELTKRGTLKIVGALYNLETAKLDFF